MKYITKEELSILIEEYDNLAEEIKEFEEYKSWKRPFIAIHRVMSQNEFDQLHKHLKETYEQFSRITKKQQDMVDKLHSKAKSLKNKGIKGKLVQEALKTRIDCLLNPMPNDFNFNKTNKPDTDCYEKDNLHDIVITSNI